VIVRDLIEDFREEVRVLLVEEEGVVGARRTARADVE
jgi:hypothetical protein